MKLRLNLCPCCITIITLKCLSWLKLQVGILNNYYLPVLVAANGGPRKQVLWPAGADGEGHFLLFASKQVLRPDTKRFHNNQMIQPLNQCVEGFTLWQLVPMAARQPFAALEPHLPMSPMSPMIAVPSGSLITCLMQRLVFIH